MIIDVNFKNRTFNYTTHHPCWCCHERLYFCQYLNSYLKKHCGFLNKRQYQIFLQQYGMLNTNE